MGDEGSVLGELLGARPGVLCRKGQEPAGAWVGATPEGAPMPAKSIVELAQTAAVSFAQPFCRALGPVEAGGGGAK